MTTPSTPTQSPEAVSFTWDRAKSELHAAIMNLPCRVPESMNPSQAYDYGRGHRDARHAAAELVASLSTSKDAPPSLRETVEELAQGFDGCMVEAVGGEIDVGEAIRTWAAQQDRIAALHQQEGRKP